MLHHREEMRRRRMVRRVVAVTVPVVAAGAVVAALADPAGGPGAEARSSRPEAAAADPRARVGQPADAGGRAERDRRGRSNGRGSARDRGGSGRAATGEPARGWPEVEWRDSRAVGAPEAGSLVRGVKLPREGRHFFSWDPVERSSPNRPWRRWGTDHAVRTTLSVIAEHRRAFPGSSRVGVGDLSRPEGGDFGIAYGPIGHASHQNGLDVDVYYPLESGRERAPLTVAELDLRRSQDLVDRFVAAGAEKVFVGPSTGLGGPPGVVQAVPNHDNHLHVRFAPAG